MSADQSYGQYLINTLYVSIDLALATYVKNVIVLKGSHFM